jgi:hypothetical protein
MTSVAEIGSRFKVKDQTYAVIEWTPGRFWLVTVRVTEDEFYYPVRELEREEAVK